MSQSRTRKPHFTAEQKVRIVRQHLLEKVDISVLCDRHGIQPSQFYTWQQQLFEHGSKAFENGRNARERELERRVEKLQAITRARDAVVAEVTWELVLMKKADGGA
jgi:transposase-like protein